MADKSDGQKLLDRVHEHGDPDGSARSDLYRKYEHKIKPRIRKMLKGKPALRGRVSTSDIYQSIMMRLRKATDYRGAESATAVLTSKARKRIRHHNNEVLAAKRNPEREDRSEEARAGLTAKTPTPLEIAVQNEREGNAKRHFGELSVQDRQILTLRDAEDLRFREIGKELGISKDAARKRYEAAKARLFAKLERNEVTE